MFDDIFARELSLNVEIKPRLLIRTLKKIEFVIGMIALYRALHSIADNTHKKQKTNFKDALY